MRSVRANEARAREGCPDGRGRRNLDGGGLWADGGVSLTGQLLLGALTAILFAALLTLQAAAVRIQALLVVAVATAAEVVGSLLWGVYAYRLDNLPVFVPPGHGLVYLAASRWRCSPGVAGRGSSPARPPP